MELKETKKLIELDLIENKEILEAKLKTKDSYDISPVFHEIKKANDGGMKYNRKAIMVITCIYEILFIICLFFAIGFNSPILWMFSILLGCCFIALLVVYIVQQCTWNKRYRKLLEEINELELKIKFNEKKLAALDE